MKTLLIYLFILTVFSYLSFKIKWKYWFIRIPAFLLTLLTGTLYVFWLVAFSGMIPSKENFRNVSKALPERSAWIVQHIPMEDHTIIYKFYATESEVQTLVESYHLNDTEHCGPALLYSLEKPWFNDDGCDVCYCNMKNTEANAWWLCYDKDSGKVLFCDFST